MKKILPSLLLAFAFLASLAPLAHAAPSLSEGRYEVPISLWHAEEDKTSFGNGYMLPTAILEKSGEETTITIAVKDNVRNFKVWYYTDGSVSGSTADAEKLTDVLINGKVYPEAFRFELINDSEFAGVKFRASIMPMSPSARLKIDYSNAVAAPISEPEPKPQTEVLPATESPASSEAVESTTEIIESTKEQTSQEETTKEEEKSEPDTQEPSSQEQETIQNESETKPFMKYLIFTASAITLAATAAFLIIKKRRQ